MQRIVINVCYGGFGLSHYAIMKYAELKGIKVYAYVPKSDRPIDKEYVPYVKSRFDKKPYFLHYASIKKDVITNSELNKYYVDLKVEDNRDDPALIKVVEELGESAGGEFAKLKIVEIPDDVEWEISEYDGWETIEEKHRSWS